MSKTANEVAETIKEHRNRSITIISHMDTDGISAAALLSKALDRLEIEHSVKFVQMLYREVVEDLEVGELTVFTDLGSSQLKNLQEKFGESDVIIADHHEPEDAKGWSQLVHFNADKEGFDGLHGISGAGMAYLIARELDPRNKDLASLGVLGAIGDIQNSWGKLRGYNRRISQDAIDTNMLEREKDLLLYGRHTQPIFRSLETFTDPLIPGVSNTTEGCISMLKDLGISYKVGSNYRRLVDLEDDEKQQLASELITRALTNVPDELADYVPGLIVGEVHTFVNESKLSLRDADEFSTSINSTARHEQPLIGYEVAKGDREVYYRSMRKLLKYHRRCIAQGMRHVEQEGLQYGPKGYLQYFDASDVLKETFVGIITGLMLNHEKSDPYRPIMGFTRRQDGSVKVSARCSKLLFLRGLSLAEAVREAAESVGGEGGGHAVAVGARIDENEISPFIEEFENCLVENLNSNPVS